MSIEEIIRIIRTGESETIEFKTNVSRDIAAEICAFANTEGGTILIGVDDEGNLAGCRKDAEQEISDKVQAVVPAPQIKISSVSIEKKRVVVVTIDKSSRFHSVGNIAYIRIGKNKRPLSIEEVTEKAVENLNIRCDSLSCTAPLSSISKEIVGEYLERRKKRGMSVLESMESNMKKLKIMVTKGKSYLPSYAGILFFCENPQEYIPNSGLRIAWFEDEEMQIDLIL